MAINPISPNVRGALDRPPEGAIVKQFIPTDNEVINFFFNDGGVLFRKVWLNQWNWFKIKRVESVQNDNYYTTNTLVDTLLTVHVCPGNTNNLNEVSERIYPHLSSASSVTDTGNYIISEGYINAVLGLNFLAGTTFIQSAHSPMIHTGEHSLIVSQYNIVSGVAAQTQGKIFIEGSRK